MLDCYLNYFLKLRMLDMLRLRPEIKPESKNLTSQGVLLYPPPW